MLSPRKSFFEIPRDNDDTVGKATLFVGVGVDGTTVLDGEAPDMLACEAAVVAVDETVSAYHST